MAFDRNTKHWVLDRVDNREPLMWPKFVRFMKEQGAPEKKLKLYKSKSYRKKVKAQYHKVKTMQGLIYRKRR